MGYAVRQDLIDRFTETELIQLTDIVNRPPTTVDEVTVARALTDADALIDGYVGKVYALPIASVPHALTKVGADIARYYLYGKRAEKDGPIERAYLQAVRWLRDVASGQVQIDVGGVPAAQAGGGTVHMTGPDRVMSRDNLRGL